MHRTPQDCSFAKCDTPASPSGEAAMAPLCCPRTGSRCPAAPRSSGSSPPTERDTVHAGCRQHKARRRRREGGGGGRRIRAAAAAANRGTVWLSSRVWSGHRSQRRLELGRDFEGFFFLLQIVSPPPRGLDPEPKKNPSHVPIPPPFRDRGPSCPG
ncbi:hypothetical protein KIL84_003454 [Mauremys mutica]|uniref:Uncharacterized protein n=1 Tax=Mauremys mutica TaxID=74926 RepID=A0A9D4ATH7_9SAUR|nr:hypothetical protein KIL84_003454 [Mauremys mutica]